MSSDMGARGGAGIGMPLMAAASPMISPKRSAIRHGLSPGTIVALVEAPERENSDAEPGKKSSKEATSSTSNHSPASWASGTSAPKMSMASARTTDREKKRCLERSPVPRLALG